MKNPKLKQFLLIFGFVVVSVIALLYGISPQWFAATFLGIAELNADVAHILRAVMCLYLALGLFWLTAAFRDAYRNTGILILILFCGGLVTGRLVSLVFEGVPAPLLTLYIVMELAMVPLAYWVWKLPDG